MSVWSAIVIRVRVRFILMAVVQGIRHWFTRYELDPNRKLFINFVGLSLDVLPCSRTLSL